MSSQKTTHKPLSRANRRHARRNALKPLAAAIMLAFAAPLYAQTTIVDIGVLPGYTPAHSASRAVAISANGNAVVGNSSFLNDEKNSRAFLYTRSGMVDLGVLAGGSGSNARAVSANGSVVVGGANIVVNDETQTRAFRWTSAGMVDLGTLGGSYSTAVAVSANGGVVAGDSYTSVNHIHAFRWTPGTGAGTGMVDLGTLGGTYSSAAAVSADGSTVVGYSNLAGDSTSSAFRWNGGTMTNLGSLGGSYGGATAVSADGNVVVGWSYNSGNANQYAFRWTSGTGAGTGMVSLGNLGGGYSYAAAVSADGSTVVGQSNLESGAQRAFRWNSGTMTNLGTLSGGTNPSSTATAVSANGSVVLGTSSAQVQIEGGEGQGRSTTTNTFFRWTQTGGMQSVGAWLEASGVTVPQGFNVTSGYGGNVMMNDDGSILAGTGVVNGQQRAWLAREGGLITDMDAFNFTLGEAGARSIQGGVGVTNLALFGSHHRSLLDSGLTRSDGDVCAWATADAAKQNNTDTQMELIEAGACKDLGSTRIGVGVGAAQARQGWTLGGGAKFTGQYVLAEVANAYSNGMESSLFGYYANFDTSLRRNYMNGAVVDSSTGSPNAASLAVRARLDWKDVTKLGNFNISPYVAYTWTETEIDGYTEIGGGFPAIYNPTTTRTTDVRVAAAGKTALSTATDLKITIEAAHRFESNLGSTSGQIIGIGAFSLPGLAVKQDWVRAIVDVDHRLGKKSALTASINSATTGGDSSWGLSAGYRMAF